MKAITLHQPWASLIVSGEKTIETRSWSTRYRGPIAIHAGMRLTREGRQLFKDVPVPFAESGIAYLDDLPYGAVVGTAILVDVIQFTEIDCQAVRLGGYVAGRKVGDWEAELGDFMVGRFGWLLDHVEPVSPPIPARGFQGLWNWTLTQS